jgi:hypothetical protein
MENHEYEQQLASMANEMMTVSYRLWALERFLRRTYGPEAYYDWWKNRDVLTSQLIRELNE